MGRRWKLKVQANQSFDSIEIFPSVHETEHWKYWLLVTILKELAFSNVDTFPVYFNILDLITLNTLDG